MLLIGVPVRERIILAIRSAMNWPFRFAGLLWTALVLGAISFYTHSAAAPEKPNDCKCRSAVGEVVIIVGTYEPFGHSVF
jgi:hypothetical protein